LKLQYEILKEELIFQNITKRILKIHLKRFIKNQKYKFFNLKS
jgi:hypothetical protein